jgi:hypothetical protein
MSKIIAATWRTGKDCIGIVATFNETSKKIKFYIGLAEGNDPEIDAENIAKWGHKLTFQEGVVFFPDFAIDLANYLREKK